MEAAKTLFGSNHEGCRSDCHVSLSLLGRKGRESKRSKHKSSAATLCQVALCMCAMSSCDANGGEVSVEYSWVSFNSLARICLMHLRCIRVVDGESGFSIFSINELKHQEKQGISLALDGKLAACSMRQVN